jgi:hypothetical protein
MSSCTLIKVTESWGAAASRLQACLIAFNEVFEPSTGARIFIVNSLYVCDAELSLLCSFRVATG